MTNVNYLDDVFEVIWNKGLNASEILSRETFLLYLRRTEDMRMNMALEEAENEKANS